MKRDHVMALDVSFPAIAIGRGEVKATYFAGYRSTDARGLVQLALPWSSISFIDNVSFCEPMHEIRL